MSTTVLGVWSRVEYSFLGLSSTPSLVTSPHSPVSQTRSGPITTRPSPLGSSFPGTRLGTSRPSSDVDPGFCPYTAPPCSLVPFVRSLTSPFSHLCVVSGDVFLYCPRPSRDSG